MRNERIVLARLRRRGEKLPGEMESKEEVGEFNDQLKAALGPHQSYGSRHSGDYYDTRVRHSRPKDTKTEGV